MEKPVSLEKRIHVQLGNELVSTNEIILTAIAWKNFLSEGEGFLYLETNSNIDKLGDFIVKTGKYEYSPNVIEVAYMSRGTEDFNNELKRDSKIKCDERKYDDFDDDYNDMSDMNLSELIDDYDPERHFVVSVVLPVVSVELPAYVRKTSLGYYWMVTPEIPPPKAFYMVKENPWVFGIIDFDPQ